MAPSGFTTTNQCQHPRIIAELGAKVYTLLLSCILRVKCTERYWAGKSTSSVGLTCHQHCVYLRLCLSSFELRLCVNRFRSLLTDASEYILTQGCGDCSWQMPILALFICIALFLSGCIPTPVDSEDSKNGGLGKRGLASGMSLFTPHPQAPPYLQSYGRSSVQPLYQSSKPLLHVIAKPRVAPLKSGAAPGSMPDPEPPKKAELEAPACVRCEFSKEQLDVDC